MIDNEKRISGLFNFTLAFTATSFQAVIEVTMSPETE
jgi:hypothetical protein